MPSERSQIFRLELILPLLYFSVVACLLGWYQHNRLLPAPTLLFSAFVALTFFFFVLAFSLLLYRSHRLLSTLLLFLGLSIVPLILFASFFSNQAYGSNLSFDLVRDFFLYDKQPFERLREFAHLSRLPILEAALGTTATLLIVWYSMNKLHRTYDPQSRAHLSAMILPFLGTSLFVSFVPNRISEQDPFSSFVGVVRPTVDVVGNDAYRIISDQRDAIVRRNFSALPPKQPINIILIMLDSLRADHLPMYGYSRNTSPFLNELYERGELQKVNRFYSTCSETYCGIASTLTGHPYHEIGRHPFTIFEAMKSAGFENKVIVAGEHRDWADLKNIYKDIPGRSDSESRKIPLIDFWSDYITEQTRMQDDASVLKGLQRIAPATAPQMLFLFLGSTHVLGDREDQYNKWLPSSKEEFFRFWGKRNLGELYKKSYGRDLRTEDLEPVRNNYDNGIYQGDAYLRQIFSLLQQKGYLHNSLVIITSDHGEGLGEHNHVGHSSGLYEEDTHIPMLLWKSAEVSIQNLEFGSQVDIMPSILQMNQIPVPFALAGKSLLEPLQDRWTLHQTRKGLEPCASVLFLKDQTLYKFIRWKTPDRASAFFNLTQDPQELHSLPLETIGPILEEAKERLAYFDGNIISSCNSIDCKERE